MMSGASEVESYDENTDFLAIEGLCVQGQSLLSVVNLFTALV